MVSHVSLHFRYGRSRKFIKHTMPAIGGKTSTWKNQNINTFISNQTQTKPAISTVTKPASWVDNTTKAKQERYVNYLNMSKPLRLPVPVAGMVKKENPIGAELQSAVNARRPPVPPKPPQRRHVYQNTAGDTEEYLVPVTKGAGIGSMPAGIEKVTRAVENDYQGIGHDHIYATIDVD